MINFMVQYEWIGYVIYFTPVAFMVVASLYLLGYNEPNFTNGE